jgi:para-aminobenzoate synthetase/4-amino-4-deoxychorismate lyase
MDVLAQRPFVLLEDRVSPGGGGRLFTRPVAMAQADDPDGIAPLLERVESGLGQGLHAAGFVAYEAAAGLEPRLGRSHRHPTSGPAAWFGLFAGFEEIAGEALDVLFGALAPPPLRDVDLGRSAAEHASAVRKVKALIEAGDVYQVNLTFPIRFGYDGDPLALYAAMRAAQPVAHGGVVALDGRTVLSVSPELFVCVRGGRAETRPMKGTAARGADEAADQEARRGLAADPKQRAENLMIVDLLRNDLSRICRAGSVRTTSLCAVETYPTFHTLTSTITGDLKTDVGLREIFQALFPCGSVVGAPKIRAAEIIADLETTARGVYTGAVGAAAPDGDLAFNVAIRTAMLTADGAGCFGVGGGVVADSDPAAEYEEARLKGRVLTDLADDFQLIETLRWTPSAGFVRLAGHLDRMGASAGALGFAFEARAIAAQLQAEAGTWPLETDRRVRLLMHRDGRLAVSSGSIGGPGPGGGPAPGLRLAVFGQALDAADPFLRHKTTRRRLHDAASAAAAAADADEMILLNRRGRVADGARASIFVARGDVLLTPPLADGALPGVLRAGLIRAGVAVEAGLTLEDLAGGPILIGNSLRGLQAAQFSRG